MTRILDFTDEQIIELFDQNPNMLMSEISQATGKSIKQLKSILMGE